MKEKQEILINEKISGFFKGDKKTKVIVLIGLLGILLIFLSNLNPTQDEAIKSTKDYSVSINELSIETEKKLKNMVEKISGAGNCEVVVTFENGIENVYANENKTTSDILKDGEKEQEKLTHENELVILDSKNGKEALKIKEIQPKVRGVVVICDGGDNIEVKQRVIQAITTSLDISSAKVYVTKRTEN